MNRKIFDYKSPNYEKLARFGFSDCGDAYSYVTQIADGQFEMRVDVARAGGGVKTAVVDLSTGDPYTLHLIEDAVGAFVGAVRAEYERVLTEISEKCFEKDVFKGDCAHAVIEYVRSKYGDELEFLWKKLPIGAVWRRKDSGKWYAVLLIISKRKLGLDSDEPVAVIDLRVDPDVLSTVVDGKKYFSGYHMNKKHWFTMCLDGSASAEEICARIDESYILAAKG